MEQDCNTNRSPTLPEHQICRYGGCVRGKQLILRERDLWISWLGLARQFSAATRKAIYAGIPRSQQRS